jgi:hypothetical protein
MKRSLLTIFLILIIGCTIRSTAERSDTEYIINAPIDVVWENTLQVLPQEKVTLKTVNRPDYFVSGWNWWGDEISVRLTASTAEKQTRMYLGGCLGNSRMGCLGT